ncbi:MAG: hypothetical protein CBB87_00160 [Micavibrio sp. TMED27]|nr:hypothetical protein [Micavibrio sp.]OUT93008.1 MAG: hypothetical protein CBB87_00160 [Micavibrio sp. TMED27]|tara:strand:+ start:5239 stop:8607 length:3369 start_codon:yes stop_codon:yes gene_type:complete
MPTDKNNNEAHTEMSRMTRIRNAAFRHKKKIIGSLVISAGIAVDNVHTNYMQAHYFHYEANKSSTTLVTGPKALETKLTVAPSGPYNIRNGYTRAQEFADALTGSGQWRLTARASHIAPKAFGIELYPLYEEKPQTGFSIIDPSSDDISISRFPTQIYQNASEIPEVVTRSLMRVENRQLGQDNPQTKNLVIEPGPLLWNTTKKIGEKAGLPVGKVSGASTLITQKTKARHTEGGRTDSVRQKLIQMLSASMEIYADDLDTRNNIPSIVQDYNNSMPFASFGQFGEVIGFADAMAIWFGNDFDDVTRLLSKPEDELSDAEFDQYAEYYREALALVMALPRPNDYLVIDRSSVDERINKFLNLFAEEGIISERLRDATLQATLHFNDEELDTRILPENPSFKAKTTLETQLMREHFHMSNKYEFSRIDGEAVSTLNSAVTADVSEYLNKLSDPEFLEAQGLTGVHIKRADPELAQDYIYGFTLYERTDSGNVLRVKADTYNGEFDINEHSRVELGSVAKYRTLITYLELIERLHQTYNDKTAAQIDAARSEHQDNLTAWMLTYLSNPETDKTKLGTLMAAMERKYSADHREAFRTDGGYQRYANYEFTDYKKEFSVSQALYQSSNLPWIRIMRDIRDHITAVDLGISETLYNDISHPDRDGYLQDFIAYESPIFLGRYNRTFFRKGAKAPEDILSDELIRKGNIDAKSIAVIHRALYPERGFDDYKKLINKHKQTSEIANKTDAELKEIYIEELGIERTPKEKGHATGITPLKIWIAEQAVKNPGTRPKIIPENVLAADYNWLTYYDADSEKSVSRALDRQNRRIQQVVEMRAFEIIHKSWERQGFPFNKMVSSLASVLGSSADRPKATAELLGIMQNNGQKLQTRAFNKIHLAKDTPYEQIFEAVASQPEQVVSPEIAQIAFEAAQGVVEHGTAMNAKDSVSLSDKRKLTIAGKTGTHDGEARRRNPVTGKLETVKDDRFGVFTFAIGDYHFGTITIAVLDQKAEDHKFTSSFNVQLFKKLAPMLRPVLDSAYGISPEETKCVREAAEYAMSLGLNYDHEYTIQVGDNLHSIAREFREKSGDETITVSNIQEANNDNYPGLSTPTLVAEKEIIIPIQYSCKI